MTRIELLAAEVAALAKTIQKFEAALFDVKQTYWAKIRDFYLEQSKGVDMGPFDDAVSEELLERLRNGTATAEDVFRVAEGAVVRDDT